MAIEVVAGTVTGFASKAAASAAASAGRITINRLWKARSDAKQSGLLESLELDHIVELDLTATIVDQLPTGVSFRKLEEALRTASVSSCVSELMSAVLLECPESTFNIILESFSEELTAALAGSKCEQSELQRLASSVFDELRQSVAARVKKLDEFPDAKQQILSKSSTKMLVATINGISLHRQLLPDQRQRERDEQWLGQYRRQAAAAHGFIEPPDFDEKRKVPIDELFVPSEITAADTPGESVDFEQWLSEIDRTVLLGDPGGGKSTTSSAVAWRLARQEDGLVPFVVILRNLVQGEESVSIVEHIHRRLAGTYQCQAPAGTVDRLLTSGRALVIFDGLDELIDTTRRREATNVVELFANQYPLAAILVTSRLVGYSQAKLDPDTFTSYRLGQFSDQRVNEYVGKWFLTIGGTSTNEAASISENFIAESASVADLRSNPLLLALMCIIYRGQHWLPRNRADIYERCATLLFDKWDSSRQIVVPLKAQAYVDAAIKHLAFWMFTEEQHEEGVTETELIRRSKEYLVPAFGTDHEAQSAAEEFVHFCRGRAWVFTDAGTAASGEALYKFTHRTFLEYFAAYELTRRVNGPEQVARMLLPRVAHAEWEMVAQLAVQIANRGSTNGAERVLTTLLESKRFKGANSRANIVGFVARCSTFIRLPVTIMERLADEGITLDVRARTTLIEQSARAATDATPKSLNPTQVTAPLNRTLPDHLGAVVAGIASGIRRVLADDTATEHSLRAAKTFAVALNGSGLLEGLQDVSETTLPETVGVELEAARLVQDLDFAWWMSALRWNTISLSQFLEGFDGGHGTLLDPLTLKGTDPAIGLHWFPAGVWLASMGSLDLSTQKVEVSPLACQRELDEILKDWQMDPLFTLTHASSMDFVRGMKRNIRTTVPCPTSLGAWVCFLAGLEASLLEPGDLSEVDSLVLTGEKAAWPQWAEQLLSSRAEGSGTIPSPLEDIDLAPAVQSIVDDWARGEIALTTYTAR